MQSNRHKQRSTRIEFSECIHIYRKHVARERRLTTNFLLVIEHLVNETGTVCHIQYVTMTIGQSINQSINQSISQSIKDQSVHSISLFQTTSVHIKQHDRIYTGETDRNTFIYRKINKRSK